jgi:hypothetical protein
MEQLKKTYYSLPPGLRARIPLGFETFVRDRVLPRLRGAAQAQALEARLWGGFSRAAAPALAALAADPEARPREAAAAALALARWEGARGETEAALAALDRATEVRPRLARERRHAHLRALFLNRLGRGDAARVVLASRSGGGSDASAALLAADSWRTGPGADEEAALAALNALLTGFGLGAVARRDPAAPLGLDNLAAAAPAPASIDGPLVTVIVPMYRAAATIGTALDSLTAQSHGDLEILVVDDASDDAGPEVVAARAARDSRIRLIRLTENRGGYAARNHALAEVTGTYVTVQDADDWSHPERIARHLADLAASGAPCNISDWARATPELRFFGPWRPSPNLVTANFSSVFFRRDLVDRVGSWDSARVSADREFVNRVARLTGTAPAEPFLPGAPLAFGRAEAGSLTRAGATHAATLLHGVRREYREAAAFWHDGLAPGQASPVGPPFFPAPWAIRPNRAAAPAHDLLFIGDFNLRGGTFHSALQMIRAARAHGLDAAILHYRRYDLDPTRPLAPGTREQARALGLRIVAPGEVVRARQVIVTYPPVFEHAMDRFPQVEHETLVMVVNQMAARDLAGSDPAYDPLRVRAHLAEVFGAEGAWIPISERVRALMAADPRYPAPHPDTWTPLIDLDAWPARPPHWHGAERPRPVLGRHGRDHPLKWPRDPVALRAAYCADKPCEVRFLGGARHATGRLGHLPRNWRDEPFGARDVQDFLADLDVFLHFPDPDYIEEFGRAPMEAMAMGVPVILPPEFAPTFGPAALYAAPDGVWPLVEGLWADRAAWEARAGAGRAFVETHCAPAAFPGRLARLAVDPARAMARG